MNFPFIHPVRRFTERILTKMLKPFTRSPMMGGALMVTTDRKTAKDHA